MAVTVTQEDVLKILTKVQDPDLGKDIVSLGFVKDVSVSGDAASFTIELTTPACPVKDKMRDEAYHLAMSLPGIRHVHVRMTSQVRPTKSKQKDELIPLVKNIVPVASGKGGVGKSTVSANLAIALSRLGAKVGLMDADVYGPSIPILMGTVEPPKPGPGGRIIPSISHGVKIISTSFFVPKGEAVIWRGPMLTKMVDQFLGAVEWGELDYLIVDLPPGTGDIQLSLCQRIPLTGAVIVSTPQDLAFQVAEKAIFMFKKLNTPILGLVENMSGFVCTSCGHEEEIFGRGGARRYAMAHQIPFLGEIPLATGIRESGDSGKPIVAVSPDSPAAQALIKVAENLAAEISIQNMGGTASGRPEPKEITQPSKEEVRIVWNDEVESRYASRDLRLACQCAVCVDEVTGHKRLNGQTIPQDVYPVAIEPVGRYAIHFTWSDGHRSGIYTFEHLRALPVKACHPGPGSESGVHSGRE
ncbi:MAG: P-loop NTPase [Candidatus Omnitrophica bacterium]|nr:P-loop NTPase [Candidatus Omnitrophota bacterium]